MLLRFEKHQLIYLLLSMKIIFVGCRNCKLTTERPSTANTALYTKKCEIRKIWFLSVHLLCQDEYTAQVAFYLKAVWSRAQ